MTLIRLKPCIIIMSQRYSEKKSKILIIKIKRRANNYISFLVRRAPLNTFKMNKFPNLTSI